MQALPDLPCILWLKLGKFSCNVLEGIYHSCSWTDWRSLATVNTLIAWNILEECTSNPPSTFNKCADQNLGHLAWPRKKHGHGKCYEKILFPAWQSPVFVTAVRQASNRNRSTQVRSGPPTVSTLVLVVDTKNKCLEDSCLHIQL